MNPSLDQFAQTISLASPENERLRLAFGYACARRVEHLLEDPEVTHCLSRLGKFLDGVVDSATLEWVQKEAVRLANQHLGSRSIDGCGHAAVSASYAVANAVSGKAIEAASYAAYASVYADGGSAAVAQPSAFELEFSWQLGELRRLASTHVLRDTNMA